MSEGPHLEAITDLQGGLETLHGGTATFRQSVPVLYTTRASLTWECVVHIFDLVGNPRSQRAYVWTAPWGQDGASEFFAYLHIPPVDSPARAVKAATAQALPCNEA